MENSFNSIAEFINSNGGIIVGPAVTSHKRAKEMHVVFKPSAQKPALSGINSYFVVDAINEFYPNVEAKNIKPYQIDLASEYEGHPFTVKMYDGNLQYRLDKLLYLPAYGTIAKDSKLGFFFSYSLNFSPASFSLFTKNKI